MKISPINKDGLPKSLQEYKTEREAREAAQSSSNNIRKTMLMLGSILK